jgi:hypothetical protein
MNLIFRINIYAVKYIIYATEIISIKYQSVNFTKEPLQWENARHPIFFFSKVGFQMMCHNLM